MRKLGIEAIKCMDGQKVIVHDCIYDESDQICTIRIVKKLISNPKSKKHPFKEVISEIILENEEFIFQYCPPFFDKCIYGEFEVYSLPEVKKDV